MRKSHRQTDAETDRESTLQFRSSIISPCCSLNNNRKHRRLARASWSWVPTACANSASSHSKRPANATGTRTKPQKHFSPAPHASTNYTSSLLYRHDINQGSQPQTLTHHKYERAQQLRQKLSEERPILETERPRHFLSDVHQPVSAAAYCTHAATSTARGKCQGWRSRDREREREKERAP